MYQIFVKGLDGKTKCLQISIPNLNASDLKNKIFDSIKIPQQFQRLVSGTRQIYDNGVLEAAQDGFYPQINVLLNLRGGKGGFGSLLRGAATKAGQKKTSNFDACRDMSGRRLRHVNAEKKLEEWKAEAEDRQLEKVAEDYLKKQLKKEKKKKGDKGFDEGAVDVEKYRVEADRAMEGVESAVKDGLVEALKLQQSGKRKMIENAAAVVPKRAKLWMLEEEDEDEEEEEVEGIDEEMKVLKQGTSLMNGNEESGCSNTSNAESASDSEMASVLLLGNAKPETGSCDDVDLRQVSNLSSGNANHCSEANVKFQKSELISLSGEDDTSCDERESSIEFKKEIPFALTSKEEQNITCSNLDDDREPNVELKTEEPISSLGESNSSCNEKEATSGSTSVITKERGEMDIICDSKTSIGGLLKFEEFDTPKDMEVLGLEKLKNELQSRGLKCGGSLSERAARLFLLKTTPVEKLHKKHFAMAKSAGK